MSKLSKRILASRLSKYEKLEKKIYGKRKKALFSQIKPNSKVLEIGPGTGINLQYFPKNIRWIGIEPNTNMHPHIKEKAKQLEMDIKIKTLKAEKLPIKDNSVDYVISTLVFCSVNNPEKAIKEIKRVLKPKGKFLFMEHVAAQKGTIRKSIQNLAPHTLWRFVSDGCHPNRETDKLIEKEFPKTEIKKNYQKDLGIIGWLANPQIVGEAEK